MKTKKNWKNDSDVLQEPAPAAGAGEPNPT